MSCLNDNIEKYLAAKNTTTACREVTCKNNIIAPQGLYYYGLPGEEHDQDLFSTQFPNTRGMSFTHPLRNIIERSDTYYPINIKMSMGICDTDQIMKLIEHCCMKNNWGSLSFFK